MIVSFTLLLSSLAFSAPDKFSAFTFQNHLYVTILGDCNNASASLVVDSLCNKNRSTRNYADSCGAEVIVATTRMLCSTEELVPKVFKFDLSNELVAPEALEFVLKFQQETIPVKINK